MSKYRIPDTPDPTRLEEQVVWSWPSCDRLIGMWYFCDAGLYWKVIDRRRSWHPYGWLLTIVPRISWTHVGEDIRPDYAERLHRREEEIASKKRQPLGDTAGWTLFWTLLIVYFAGVFLHLHYYMGGSKEDLAVELFIQTPLLAFFMYPAFVIGCGWSAFQGLFYAAVILRVTVWEFIIKPILEEAGVLRPWR